MLTLFGIMPFSIISAQYITPAIATICRELSITKIGSRSGYIFDLLNSLKIRYLPSGIAVNPVAMGSVPQRLPAPPRTNWLGL
jgi:hypothetical protein